MLLLTCRLLLKLNISLQSICLQFLFLFSLPPLLPLTYYTQGPPSFTSPKGPGKHQGRKGGLHALGSGDLLPERPCCYPSAWNIVDTQ